MTEREGVVRGRCLCGAIEVELEGPLEFVAHCHCQSCRLSHGAPLVTWTGVPLERFRMRGDERLRWYRSSETIEWGFCDRCGSSLLYRAIAPGHHEAPKLDRMYVTVASLVDPIDQPANAHVSYEERVPWLTIGDDVPKFRGKGKERIDG